MYYNGRMVFVDFFPSQSRKIFFSFFLSFFFFFFFSDWFFVDKLVIQVHKLKYFLPIKPPLSCYLNSFFWIFVFEKFILVDIVVLIREFFIYFYFSKTLFLFVSAAVVIVLLIQIFVKFWSTFCQTNYYHE